LTDFKYSFISTLARKFAMQQSVQIPPPLKHVATLPCEILMTAN